MKNKFLIFNLLFILLFIGCTSKKFEDEVSTKKVTINNIEFEVSSKDKFFTWDTLPKNVFFERKNLKEFTNKNGDKHFYEVIYLPSANLNWYQTAYLAQNAGGYLVSITSEEENDFIFSLISNKLDQNKNFLIPYIGSYQKKDKWYWLSKEIYKNEKFDQRLDFINNKSIKKLSAFIIEYEKI